MLLPPISRSHPESWFAMNNGWVFSLNLILSRDTSKIDNFLNPFWFSVPFLYPLEMSENLWLSGVSSRYRNGTLGWKGLIKIFSVLRNRIIILHGKITFTFHNQLKWFLPKDKGFQWIPLSQIPSNGFFFGF